MSKILFLDTNVLLEDPEDFTTPFIISDQTLLELEAIKTNKNKTEDLRGAARKAIRWLSDHHDDYEVMVTNNSVFDVGMAYSLDISEPDVLISCAALAWQEQNNKEVKFVTHDLSCRNIAEKILGLDVEWFENKHKIYKGYKEVIGDTTYINEYMANINYSDWYVNEYIIIGNTDDDTIKEMRFDGNMFVPLKLPPSKYIKGKNSLQRCALDILNNPNITVSAIVGGYGSGKSFLSSKMALYSVQEKGWQSRIVAIREIISDGAEIGWLPGEKLSKIYDFVMPLADQLDGGEFELESLMQRGVVEANTPYFIKGRTFNNCCILCDESEDLTEKQIRLVGTRVGENSRIIYNGDYKQSVINPTKNNALNKMNIELRGNPKFACIYLEDDVRSETSRLFANLFEN